MNRRNFIRTTGTGTIALAFWRPSLTFGANSPSLRKFVQALPALGAGIPVATPRFDPVLGSAWDYYELQAGQYQQRLHPDLPNATTLWGYADTLTNRFAHLGPVIVARRGRPARVRLTNNLPGVHILPVDLTLSGAEAGANRAVLHLHGGFTPWTSDGGPQSWFAPDGTHGPSFLNNAVLNYPSGCAPAAGQADYLYPNDQSARLMWYHDHAMGTTRLNAYAGLASAYLLTDDFEQALVAANAIPSRQLPIIIQDKTFKPSGDLWYPDTYEGDIGEGTGIPNPSCVPEFFGDTMLVNGLVYPYVNLERRKYRLRILNACNARFCRLQLYYAQSTDDADPRSTDAHPGKTGPEFLQIGTEAGFLPESTGPQWMDRLLLAPAERGDVIIDLSEVPEGSRLILHNDAPAPFPNGDSEMEYPNRGTASRPGYGPDTRSLLQIRVTPLIGAKDPKPLAPLKLPAIAPLSPDGLVSRDLTLNEDFDQYGRLIQRLGTSTQVDGSFARNYMDQPTEVVNAGAVEVWRIFNLTADTHPIHFHLVNVQVLSRQAFNVKKYTGADPAFIGTPREPDPNETGWKETVRMNPGECTTVIAKFDLPTLPGINIPLNSAFQGHEYVWHCHILEHEEHDMMRPLIVKPSA
jgi:spore coat protein A